MYEYTMPLYEQGQLLNFGLNRFNAKRQPLLPLRSMRPTMFDSMPHLIDARDR